MSARGHRVVEALAVGAIVLVVLIATAHHYGLGYDEPVYMTRMQQAAAWLRTAVRAPLLAASDAVIRQYWDAKADQQPGFVKLWGALTTPLVSGWLHPLAALRVGTVLLVAVLAASLYLFAASVWGRVEALAAVGALFTMPRVFAHSHLFALDAPVMATGFLTVHLLYLCARERSWAWAAAAGAMWGVALGCKVNAFFIPVIVLPWLALCARDALLPAAVCGALLGPTGFWLSWPWLWHDTFSRLGEYLRFHFRHWQIGVTYFGRRYEPAPWHYPTVMTLITVPAPTLLAVAVGAWRVVAEWAGAQQVIDWRERWRNVQWRRRAAAALLGWALLVNYLFNSLPGTPKYNGCRLFLPVFPFFALLAGVGIGWAVRAVLREIEKRQPLAGARRTVATVLLLSAALVLPLRATIESHPHQLSYYNACIGGLSGAQRHGMEVTYWGETYLHAVPWLNAHAPRGATIWIDPPGMGATIGVYQTLGIMRDDLWRTSGDETLTRADFAVFQNKVTEFSGPARRLLAERTPIVPAELDGVPLIFIFDLREGGQHR